ncbi:uncharacterized protein CDAR_248761 [Caerostris darwini]|uniref:Uncharacterized protein n=1 Tax=Caerostris darwini TaxID=1538125 RepID=A0AAV4UAW0_9ARAC|nr:uncharacterized protein CDAR_248761 [Caerostris darwini]
MSFYLTLPSDSSLHYFPNNKISSFVTQLPSPITLDGKWVVGLAEIIYPYTWYNVNETNNMFGFDLGDSKLNTRKLSPGSYETIPDILKAMALTSHEGKINFKFNPHTKRVKIKTTESDIVQHEVVGHVEAPLFRVVRISGKDGDVINVLYDRPHYVPVIRQSGSGISHYEGISFQRGYGLGGVFRLLFRAALPFLVRGGKVVGKEALVTGTKVINDVLTGKDLETAAKNKSKEAGKEMRDISLNAQYLFLFKIPRDRLQIMHLGRQLYPSQTKFFREVYEDTTSKRFSYILINLKSDTDDSLRLRSGIFPGDKYCAYQPR